MSMQGNQPIMLYFSNKIEFDSFVNGVVEKAIAAKQAPHTQIEPFINGFNKLSDFLKRFGYNESVLNLRDMVNDIENTMPHSINEHGRYIFKSADVLEYIYNRYENIYNQK